MNFINSGASSKGQIVLSPTDREREKFFSRGRGENKEERMAKLLVRETGIRKYWKSHPGRNEDREVKRKSRVQQSMIRASPRLGFTNINEEHPRRKCGMEKRRWEKKPRRGRGATGTVRSSLSLETSLIATSIGKIAPVRPILPRTKTEDD